MAAPTHTFSCTHCDAQFQKWLGRCLECGSWGTIVERKMGVEIQTKKIDTATPVPTRRLNDIVRGVVPRIPTNISELDRVFGGGIVPGSLILLSGDPGIGKSTLALQLAASIPNALYISGEESVEQVILRADRLMMSSPTLELTSTTSVEAIIATIDALKPPLTIIDSIHTIASSSVSGECGSVSQVRAATSMLLQAVKERNTAAVLIGHVTKDGTVAGPKTLEHLVDVALSFEGTADDGLRLLRANKNRFGSTEEVGCFTMKENGLIEVTNPSELLLRGRGAPMPGSVLTCAVEGTRPMMVEIQALVNKTVFGYPIRKVHGIDLNRLHVIAAVLQRHADINLGTVDIHVNVVGGLTLREPAIDLAIALAIGSAYEHSTIAHTVAAFGEVGLGGEVRPVRHSDKRLRLCADLGIEKIFAPRAVTHVRELFTRPHSK